MNILAKYGIVLGFFYGILENDCNLGEILFFEEKYWKPVLLLIINEMKLSTREMQVVNYFVGANTAFLK